MWSINSSSFAFSGSDSGRARLLRRVISTSEPEEVDMLMFEAVLFTGSLTRAVFRNRALSDSIYSHRKAEEDRYSPVGLYGSAEWSSES